MKCLPFFRVRNSTSILLTFYLSQYCTIWVSYIKRSINYLFISLESLNNKAEDYRPVSTAEYTGAGSTTCFCGKDGKMLLNTSLLIVSAGAYGKKRCAVSRYIPA